MTATRIAAVALFILFFTSCNLNVTDPASILERVASVFVSPKPDTVFLSISSSRADQWSGTLSGIVVNVNQKIITNTGVMTEAEFTVTLVDSVRKSLDATRASWFTDNPQVVSLSSNRITARAPGVASVWAVYNGVTSDAVAISVRSVDEAPALYLSPPEMILTFQNSVGIAGNVQTQFSSARLTIVEEHGTVPSQSILYNTDGSFALTLSGLLPGTSRFIVTAAHQTNAGLFTRKTKVVYYYPINSPEADSIIGHWRGTLGDRILDFTIERSLIPGRYDIHGTVDIRFPGYGVLRNISLPGIVGGDGTVFASLTQTYDQFNVTGTLTGTFRTTKTADGTISAIAKRSGWSDLGAKESWSADKVPY